MTIRLDQPLNEREEAANWHRSTRDAEERQKAADEELARGRSLLGELPGDGRRSPVTWTGC